METTELVKTEMRGEINIYYRASELKVSDEEQKKIAASFDKNQIEIRPDGLIFLPQTFWRERLNQSFGIGQWALIPKASHKDPTKDKLYLPGVLLVRGVFVAEAIGEAELHSNNPMQSWASVWESAKSDCITRCCKDLGIASELWQPQFIEAWKKENAIQVWRDKTGKKKNGEAGSYQWRKKTATPFFDEKNGSKQEVVTTSDATVISLSNKNQDEIIQKGIGELKKFTTAVEMELHTPSLVEWAVKKGLDTEHIKKLEAQIKITVQEKRNSIKQAVKI